MTYKIDGTDYDEDDFDDMTDEELEMVRRRAEKQGRDADLMINNGQQEWLEHDKDPNFGLTKPEYQRQKTLRANATGFLEALELYRYECRLD